jgi:hypothetical protein
MRMPLRYRLVLSLVLLISLHSNSARGQARPDSLRHSTDRDSLRTYFLRPILVQGRIDDLVGRATSASQGHVGQEDIAERPLSREGEVLETVPGVIVTQHSGEGKANQYFLRGFNLDHGTDFRTEIDGMPVNMPTHAHGQGYTDLNFLIPEVVSDLEFQKGVYYADIGDFGSAGGARIRLAREFPKSFFKVESGENGFGRVLGAGSQPFGAGTLLVAAEVKAYDGVWNLPQNLAKRSGLARYTWKRNMQEFSILAMGYDNTWHSSDQIPRRAIENGTLDVHGQVDSTLGGASSRYSLSGSWRRTQPTNYQRADLYAISYDLDLFSNFTYFLDDPVNGDQFEQVDKRFVLGGSFEHNQSSTLFGREHRWSAGLQTRTDIIREVGLHHTRARRRISTVRDDDVVESTAGVYLQARSTWREKLRTVLGVRGDLFYLDVNGLIDQNSGTKTDGQVSPKATIVVGPWARSELYANAGLGFHSNDARGTTIRVDPETGQPVERVDPLVTSRGAEVGVRVTPTDAMRSTVSLWLLDLDSELLFVGDAGTTEPSDKTRRFGVEFANFWRPRPWLSVDADFSLSHARLENVAAGQNRIPGALENVLSAGVTVERWSDWFGTVRVRHFGQYPLIEDNSVRAAGTTLVDASLGRSFSRMRLTVNVLNLGDSSDNDIQYFYPSRLEGEPAAGIEDVHLHPVEPRQFRGSVTWEF